jgi:hypothetical protein
MEKLLSNFQACYADLLGGAGVEDLLTKYVSIEVYASLELLRKGVTMPELKAFLARREQAIRTAPQHQPVGCKCGAYLFDETALQEHIHDVHGWPDNRGGQEDWHANIPMTPIDSQRRKDAERVWVRL